MPAPSPGTKPSRSRSKGREARSGSALRVESAFMALKPAMQEGEMTASVPPVIMASARPSWMILKESPTACAPAAQAVANDRFGPLAPKRIEIIPGAMLPIIMGMKKGLTLRGPFAWMLRMVSSMNRRPPSPQPVTTPMRGPLSAVMISPASSSASRVAATA